MFSIIMNGKNGKTKLNAEIQLARFVDGRYIPDVIIIKNAIKLNANNILIKC